MPKPTHKNTLQHLNENERKKNKIIIINDSIENEKNEQKKLRKIGNSVDSVGRRHTGECLSVNMK